MQPDWFKQIKPPSEETVQEYLPRHPFQIILPFLILALLCCLWALLASHLGALMKASFLLVVPFIIGALIVYIQNYRKAVSFIQSFKVIIIFLVLLLLFSIVVLHEGAICVVIMTPILLGGMLTGALFMKGLCYKIWKPNKTIYSLVLLPFILLPIPEKTQLHYDHVDRSILINAPAKVIWQQLNHADNIQPHEFKPSVLYSIGVPYPVSGLTKPTNEGLIRYSTWQKNIHFEEIIQQSKPNQYLSWTYRFSPTSIPQGALDDHVSIGGKYFDLRYTSFELTPINDQQTKLTLKIDYRISTEVNFYANQIAQLMVHDFSNVILDFYKNRSERAIQTPQT